MKKKIGLTLLGIFTVLQIITCGINIALQHNINMNTYWLIFPISGKGICYPLFIFTILLTAAAVYVFLHRDTKRTI